MKTRFIIVCICTMASHTTHSIVPRELLSKWRINTGQRHSLLVQALYTTAVSLYCLQRGVSLIRAMRKPVVTLEGWSIEDLTTRPLTTASRNYLSQLTMHDWVQWYETKIQGLHQDSVAKFRHRLLASYNLYQFDTFLTLIKPWPEYEHHVLNVVQQINKNRTLRDILNAIQGFRSNKLISLLQQEARRLSVIKQLSAVYNE